MAKDAGLIFLGPTLRGRAVQAGFGVATEFTDDQGLLISNVPHRGVRVLRQLFVPADVFVHADYVEGFAQRIIDILIVSLGTHQERCGDQPGGAERFYVSGESSAPALLAGLEEVLDVLRQEAPAAR
jgi:hypothetical protein